MAMRRANKLTAREVWGITREGWHGDGAGLWLRITKDGRCAWTFVYRLNGKRRELGLGPARGPYAVTLASAREGAAAARKLIGQGKCPVAEARAAKAAAEVVTPTFATVADEYYESMRPKWKSAVYARAWEEGLTVKAASLRPLPVDQIAVADVLKVLKPVWQAHPETGRRFRGQIEAVLDAATARGFRHGPNPAAWKGNLKALLPARAAHQRKHHPALPYNDMRAFVQALRAQSGIAAKALEFLILTNVRTGEVRQATWAQIDMRAAVWTIPATRMKANREHRVPLSGRAMDILRELEAARVGDTVFPSYDGGPLSTNAMLALVYRMGRKGIITVHGFRSSFSDFAGDVTNASYDVCRTAMSHSIRNAAEAAYRRGDAFEKRRVLMESWAQWCEPNAEPGSNVVSLAGARA